MKKNRSNLKQYFKKGAIPTESNFADLIDSMLNQDDDGISKLPNDPLSVTAVGTDEALLNFYRLVQNNPELTWQLKQNPGGQAGFSISDASGTRLFVASGSGDLGVGTTSPDAKLQVTGAQDKVSVHVGDGGGGDFTMDVANGQGLVSLVAGAKITSDGKDYAFTGTRGASKITLHDGQIKFHTSDATSGTAGASAAGLSDSKMVLTNDGSLGIGTDSPKAKLQVVGGAIMPDAGNSESAGLLFPPDPGGGSGDRAWMRYYSRDGEAMTLEIGVSNDANDHIALMPSGGVGIGTNNPRSALDTGTGVISGAGNDYVKAQFTMSGGGTVTWGGPGGRLKWTKRFIGISMEKPHSFSSGYVDINQPTSDIPAGQVYDGNARSATADGVLLNGWEALYAVHTPGGNNTAVSFQIVKYTNDFNAPSNWLLVAVVNYDDHTVRLGTGVILSKNSSSSQSSPIPRGVIMLWYGQINDVPDGWALCDGGNGTPNLKDRFVVGAGASYGVGDKGGADTVQLSVAQMPSHNHNNGDYGYLLSRRSDGHYTSKDTDTTVGEPDLIHSAYISSTGGNQAHENRPPYYALAYIMKL